MDIFSLGLIYFETLSYFATQHERVMVMNQLRRERKMPEEFMNIYETEAKLISKMLEHDQDKRLDADGILKCRSYVTLKNIYGPS